MPKAIHFCIDLQAKYKPNFHPDAWNELKANIGDLVEGLKKSNIPTVFIAYTDKKQLAGTLYGIHPFASLPVRMRSYYNRYSTMAIDYPLSDDSLIGFKSGISAQMDPYISAYVRQHRFTTIILSGLHEASEFGNKRNFEGCCVSQTAFHFSCHGKETIIAAEATDAAIDFYHYCADDLTHRQTLHRQVNVQVLPIQDILKRFQVSGASP